MNLADELIRLIDIPSPTGSEEALRDAIAGRLARLEPRVVGKSVVVGMRTGRPLMSLYGHLDTVPEQGNLPGRIEGDRVVGLGASDMKGGLAVMIALLEDEAVARGPYDILGVFYDAEEGPADRNGLERVLDEVPDLLESEFAVVMEPTDGELQLGCQGTINARVEFHGISAHSARPWLGQNAITKAGRWMAEMHERGWRDVEVEDLIFKETFSVTLAEGGVAANMIPPKFVLNVNHRYPPDRTLAEAEAMVREICDAADSVEIVDRAMAAAIPEDNEHLERLRALAPKVAAKTAWTDVARLAARGVPAVNYGPGEVAQAHKQDESAPIGLLDRCFETMREFLA
ncbi:MAG TPA: succinyl-diaminopimelate desuccinylase [Acidimicrobiia bacterium]|nr:succinyl-diaminopimelate desuccinylase [Acidimicrobiia bacterium]